MPRRFLPALAGVLAAVLVGCSGGGGSGTRTDFEFGDAKPAKSRRANGLLLLAPKPGAEPEGRASGHRNLRRTMGPTRIIRLGSVEGTSTISISISETPLTDGVRQSDDMVDVNGSQAALIDLDGFRSVTWLSERFALSAQGRVSRDTLLSVARGIRERGPGIEDVRVSVVPDGYERRKGNSWDGGSIRMAMLTFAHASSDAPRAIVVGTVFEKDAPPEALAQGGGVDGPGSLEAVDIRGTRGIYAEMSFPVGKNEFESRTLMWLERPDVLGMVMAYGSGFSREDLTGLADGLEPISGSEWDDRFPSSGPPPPGFDS